MGCSPRYYARFHVEHGRLECRDIQIAAPRWYVCVRQALRVCTQLTQHEKGATALTDGTYRGGDRSRVPCAVRVRSCRIEIGLVACVGSVGLGSGRVHADCRGQYSMGS